MYVGYALYLYSSSIRVHTKLLWLFVVLVGGAIVITISVSLSWASVGATIFFSFLVALFLGAAGRVNFQYKTYAAVVFYFVIFAIMAFFASLPIISSAGRVLVAVFISYLVLKDYVRFVLGEWNQRMKVWSLVIALLGTQMLWVSTLLSVGFLNVAALLLVFWIGAVDIMLNFFSGTLNWLILRRTVLFFVIFSSLVLIASWASI